MPGATGVYRFGSFQLDVATRRLTRGRRLVARLPKPHTCVLARLLSSPEETVAKERLTDAGWGSEAVGGNSVEKVVSSLRHKLGRRRDGSHYIETDHRAGYRFTGSVQCRDVRLSDEELDAQIAPHLAFTGGRPLLEKLHLGAALEAIEVIGEILRTAPDYVKGHVAIACAYLFVFESTRADAEPDRASLEKALHHALEARTRAPRYGEAWATLGIVLHRMGQTMEAIAALHEAIGLDNNNWRHHLRLASVSWGEERLSAARDVLRLCPGLAFAYWFIATVFVARQAFGDAAAALDKGCASQDAQDAETGRFNAVGLHFLRGLVRACAGEIDAALKEFDRELADLDDRLLYARECRANTWYAIGGIRLRLGNIDGAHAAFEQTLALVPGHVLAAIGLAWTLPPSKRIAALLALRARVTTAQKSGARVNAADVVIAKAVVLALQGDHVEAARICHEFLRQAEPGSAGWLIPADPLLHVTAHGEAWTQTLATLRDRAA